MRPVDAGFTMPGDEGTGAMNRQESRDALIREALNSIREIASSALSSKPHEVDAAFDQAATERGQAPINECAHEPAEPGRWDVLAWLERVINFEGTTEQAKAMARDAGNHIGRPRFDDWPAGAGYGFVEQEPGSVTFPTRAHELEWLIEQCRTGRPIPTALQDPRRAGDLLRLALVGYQAEQADRAARDLAFALGRR